MDDADLVKAVQELQKSVAALEQRNNDLVLKAQIFSLRAVRSWGWDSFLSEPEFWENIYDSGLADCQGRCIKNLQEEYKACDTAHERYSTEWENCRAEALGRAVLCQERCTDANPVVP